MGRDLLLNSLHRQAGAVLGPWLDWTVPLRFTDSLAEYEAARERAGLIDYSAWGLIEVQGADRVGFLHNLLTNDIKRLQPSTGCQACLLTPQAKLVAHLLVLAGESAHWLLVPRARAEATLSTLDRYLITEDVRLHDRTQPFVLVALQGPHSLTLLNALLGETVVAVPQPLAHQERHLDGTPIRVIAFSLTSEPGALLAVSAENAAWLWQRLVEHGRPHGLIAVGWDALNMLRIESGIPWDGIDMDATTLLPETGLEERAVSYTKGCYVGQEIIARLQTYGSVSRKLMGLVCDGQRMPSPHDVIAVDGQPGGEITSACLSPTLKRPIALGYVRRPFYEIGQSVIVQTSGRDIPATLTKRPFV